LAIAIVAQARLGSSRLARVLTGDPGSDAALVRTQDMGESLQRGFVTNVAKPVEPERRNYVHVIDRAGSMFATA
jgi:hypothetical protein